MENLLIFPFSGTGIEALDCLGDKFKCIGFVTDDQETIGTVKMGIPVYGREAFLNFPTARVIAVPGSPKSFLARETIINGLNLDAQRFTTVIHPKAFVSTNAQVGKNVLIMAGVVITSNAIVKDNICILPNSVIHHDSIIGNYTLIGANVTIAGNVGVGNNCYIGAASSIINGITIGEKSLIGIGSNVIKECPPSSKMVGNPSKNLNLS